MPILGIVLSLDPESLDAGQATLERLRRVPHLELGERQGAKQPAVLECADDRRAETLAGIRAKARAETHAETHATIRAKTGGKDRVEAEIDELLALEGVLHVDVVFAEFADLLPETESTGTTPGGVRDDEASPRETPEETPRVMERESWT